MLRVDVDEEKSENVVVASCYESLRAVDVTVLK